MRLEATHLQLYSKLVLKQVFQLTLANGVRVPTLASVIIEEFDEEGHSSPDITHDDNWFKRMEIRWSVLSIDAEMHADMVTKLGDLQLYQLCKNGLLNSPKKAKMAPWPLWPLLSRMQRRLCS